MTEMENNENWFEHALSAEDACEFSAGPIGLPEGARQVSADESFLQSLIDRILHGLGLGKENLARLLHVTTATLADWYNGKTFPSLNELQSLESFGERAIQASHAVGLHYTDFKFICNFSDSYPPDFAERAYDALRRTLRGSIYLPRSDGGFNIDIIIRAAPLSKEVRAHCFADHTLFPRVFVVLVNNALSERDQYKVAWDELYAHAATTLVNRVGASSSSRTTPQFIIR